VAIKTFYAIIDITGNIKRRRGTKAGSLYETQREAVKQAIKGGDAVVRVQLNTDVEPVFIRGLVLKPPPLVPQEE